MPPRAGQNIGRVLIAAEQPQLRHAIVKSIAEHSSLKVIGFVRESSTLQQRVELSLPDLLVVHAALLENVPRIWLEHLSRQPQGQQVLVLGREATFPADRKALNQSNFGFLALPNGGIEEMDSPGFVKRISEAISALLSQARLIATIPPPLPVESATHVCRHTTPRRGFAQALVIGASTGGPQALAELFSMFDKDFPLPIAVVQHMPAIFTTMLADRLNRICSLQVCEGDNDMALIPGRAVIGRGGFHMRLHGPAATPYVRLDRSPPENSCRPAVDVLFRSAAEVFGGNVLTVVLTGMGKDGLVGARQLGALGSPILVQDAATSTVWGMPGAIAQAGLATNVLPLQQIVPELMRYL